MEKQDNIIENSKSINDFVTCANSIIASAKQKNRSKFDIINEISLLYHEHNETLKSFTTPGPKTSIREDINDYIETLIVALKEKRDKFYHKILAL